MQLITQKHVPPSSLPVLPATKAKSHVYQLGISFCPTMDLVATYPVLTHIKSSPSSGTGSFDSDYDDDATKSQISENNAYDYEGEDEEPIKVDVWRFNGQRVFTVEIESENESKIEVCQVKWRSDGQMIAILSSDSTVRLVNSFSGKIVHRFSSTPTYTVPTSPTSPRTRRSDARFTQRTSKAKPLALSYTTHFTNPDSTQSLLHAAFNEKSVVLDDLLSLNADMSTLLDSPADLPLALAHIDVESFLPRLSCLPPIGFGGEDIFSTRISIDAIFHSNKKNIQGGMVDVLFAGSSDGMASLRIFDSFEIGGIDLNSASGLGKATKIGRMVKLAGWPFTTEIFVIVEDIQRSRLHLLNVDLQFITQSSTTLSILAMKATQLQNLLRYLTQIQSQLARELKTAFDLPTRYLRNINEDLEGQNGGGASFKTAAYHAIVTGEVAGAFKEWLSEQVGDRGVKRWEKSVGECLELVRRLVSEAWCPAVERTGVVVSRLDGLAGWTAQGDLERTGLGLDRKTIGSLRDTIDVMTVCSEECLKMVVKEISGFASFIKWLKWEVEASALEDTSERLDEMRESADHGDVMKVLEYIEQGPQESVVKSYIQSNSSSTDADGHSDLGFYAGFREQKTRRGSHHQTPAFDDLLTRMRRLCDHLFEQIAQKLQQDIMTNHLAQLATGIDRNMLDIRVTPQKTRPSGIVSTQVHIISRKKDDKTSIIYQIVETSATQSKTKSTSTHSYRPPEAEEILDLKFVDDNGFMVLVKTAGGVNIYSRDITQGQEHDWELRHEFEDGIMESGMKPAKLEVNGRKKRRVVGVVDADGKGYVIFDLDSGDSHHEDDEEDEEMSG